MKDERKLGNESSKNSKNCPQGVRGKFVRYVFIRDLVLTTLVGVHGHEKNGQQRVCINLDMDVPEPEEPIQDKLSEVVCYEEIVLEIRTIVNAGHINLVETLAERIASKILSDERISAVRVRIEKLDVFPDAASVGVEIERTRR